MPFPFLMLPTFPGRILTGKGRSVASFSLFLLLLSITCSCASITPSKKRKSLDGLPVLAVRVFGNETLAASDIVDKLSLKPAGFLGQGRVQFQSTAARLDRKRIAAYYREHGFFRTKVEDPVALPHRHGVAILYYLEEGSRTILQKVDAKDIPTTTNGTVKEILAKYTVQEGAPFDYLSYLLAKDAINTALINDGYAHAQAAGEVKVDRDKAVADVTFSGNTGPRVYFGKTKLTGITSIPKPSILHRIAYKEGQLYDPSLLDDTSQNLRELGFSSVKMNIDRDGSPKIADVTAQANDGKPREIKLGVGGGKDANRWEIRLRSDYTQKRFLHPLNTLEAHAQLGRIFIQKSQFTYKALGSLSRQDFLAPLYVGTVQGNVIADDYEAFTAFDINGGVFIERPYAKRKIRAKLGWQLHHVNIKPDAGLTGDFASNQFIGYFVQSISFDFRDNPLSATKGVYLGVAAEEAGTYALGEAKYFRGTADFRGYIPLGSRIVLATRAAVGGIFTQAGQIAPLTRRFYGGGSSDHRGFAFRTLSPQTLREDRDADGVLVNEKLVPTGGAFSVLGTGEARFVLKQFESAALVGALFLDVGDVTETKDDIDFGNLHYASGFGLRFQTPIGPIRLDFAYRLNRTSPMEADGRTNPAPGSSFADRFLFHATIGESF